MNETLNIQNGVSPITIDTEPTEGSTRPVMGGGVYNAIQNATERFIVNLTPTALDFTAGTMDKTVGEINDAYNAGKTITFSMTIESIGTTTWDCDSTGMYFSSVYKSFNSTTILDVPEVGACWIWFTTGITDNPDKNTWVASIYPLGS